MGPGQPQASRVLSFFACVKLSIIFRIDFVLNLSFSNVEFICMIMCEDNIEMQIKRKLNLDSGYMDEYFLVLNVPCLYVIA